MFIRQGLEFDGIFSGRVGDWYSKVSLQVLHYPYGALQSLFTVSVTMVERHDVSRLSILQSDGLRQRRHYQCTLSQQVLGQQQKIHIHVLEGQQRAYYMLIPKPAY